MTDDDIIARMTAVQNSFEQWAQSHGGLSLRPVGTGGGTRNGRFPAIYWNDETEIAWRAWANNSAQLAAAPVAQEPIQAFIAVLDASPGPTVQFDKDAPCIRALRAAAPVAAQGERQPGICPKCKEHALAFGYCNWCGHSCAK